MNTQNNNQNGDWTSWIPIVVLFLIPYTWPIALFLLFRKLMGMKGKKRPSSHPYDILREQQPQQAKTAAPPESAAPQKKKKGAAAGQVRVSSGKWMTAVGAVLSGLFGVLSVSEIVSAAVWNGLMQRLTNIVPLLGFFCLGLVLLYCGLARTRKARRMRKYLAMIGKHRSVSIDALVRTTGIRRRKVLNDLQDMLDDGLLPAGWLDLSRDLLVLSSEGIPDEQPQRREENASEKPQDDNAILQEIRQVNDAIPDPVMSRKIDRIGEITGKILDYQRQNPGRDSQLRSFLSYYLPTTLKILRAYAQLDAQGVEGENISAAKARIEGMMDKVVEGFENQLDKLFQDSAMDISSDVAVLEKMLEKDGLAGQSGGMTLEG